MNRSYTLFVMNGSEVLPINRDIGGSLHLVSMLCVETTNTRYWMNFGHNAERCDQGNPKLNNTDQHNLYVGTTLKSCPYRLKFNHPPPFRCGKMVFSCLWEIERWSDRQTIRSVYGAAAGDNSRQKSARQLKI